MRSQFNLPNALTLFRIFLVPVLVVVILTRIHWKEWISVGVFLLAAGTDWLDGWLARRHEQVTTLGKLLDPLADKLLISGALVSLVEVGVAPAWMVVIIIGREFAVTGLRGIAAERGIALAALPWGKAKMLTQVACVVFLLLGSPEQGSSQVAAIARPVGLALLWATVVVAAISGLEYFLKFWKLLEQQPGASERAEGASERGEEDAPPPPSSKASGS